MPQAHPTLVLNDPKRKLKQAQYLGLFLLGLLNPVLKSTRALCAASHIKRIQQEICGGPVRLTAFSDAQHLVNPVVLDNLFRELSKPLQDSQASERKDPSCALQWFARDSSLFAALPRMTWALYGGGRAGSIHRAVRLHVNLHLLSDSPEQVQITTGRYCERKSWKQQWQKGAGYVGDRYFSKNFKLFGELEAAGCAYVLRLNEEATVQVEQELPISQADRRAGVIRQAWVRLGQAEFRSVRVRLIWIESKDCALMLVTNLSPDSLSAELVAMLYRRRWQIECFFRWVKCVLGCGHWYAEGPNGVPIQLYLALISAVLLQLWLGRRPNKRMLELIQMHQMGWATDEELIAGLQREQQREEKRKK